MRKDEGLRGRGETALLGQHLEVTPAVPVMIRQDRSESGGILGPDDGGFLPLRVPVPQPFVQQRPDGMAFGSLVHHPVGRQVMCARMQLSLIHISEPTRLLSNSYAVFCL